ncbi:MAG: hypothetical protein A2915_04570 [Candidatus Yanofskybacteria bacterium RIFCSPLOWO2_01_FULL_41_34]|uniref:Thrombospondin type 3 repeat superfamily protein n=1 Tax=Candidatus Yanofskybacteria bacterium RIFCSPHIGHO2_01_FULL_41_26 TaxID=1802661 RepID=A0A1F8EC77_9BACT|nr:MAG: hypothetical protein A2649_03675 [Candidatus Yanofskybacteria bacterium RIFCSPHIGHO2_01_FULL_41_26]OGN21670.1 MAG: hypothetical protein A2915_04570 [Candidatus Yanofskybacteria bacterium RIFCSPLOWO2_01_FULL_41_34]
MANKIKFFVGFLALIALFSVYSVFNSLSDKPAPFAAMGIENPLPNPDVDADHDGLDNREESYWNTDFQNPDTDSDGFKDGEEVASGHDPLIPSPNDIMDSGNLTEKLSKLTLSGLYEGSLRPDNPNYDKSLNDMALAVMDDAVKSLSPKINIDQLQIAGPSKENQEKYIKEVSPLFENLLSAYLSEIYMVSKNLNVAGKTGFEDEYANFFKNQSQKYNNYYQSGLKIPTPKNWELNHVGLLKLFSDLSETDLAISNGKIDPVRAVIAMDKLVGFFDIVPDLIEAYSDKIKSEGLDIGSTFFGK